MAGSTEHYALIKPADNDAADNTPLNTNFDRIDSALAAHDDALAIVANGNTHAAITSGQFVYVRNHETLANGLYTANSNIAANATLSSSNLTADSSGGLNALNSKITAMDFGYYSLIDGTTLTTSYAEIPTYNSRKFSDYKIIEILAVKDNWAFLVGIIPTSIFPSRSGVACFITPDIEVDVKYKSDTSVEAKYIASSINPVSLQIFAIK